MEVQRVTTDLASEGTFEHKDYRIELNAHAYSVLSKGMYSDPYRAIIRELCCNAMDSHIMAGRPDVPFEVYLPNTMSPTFKVRDFGTGLSEVDMDRIYSSFFTSSKQNDNRQTGCFGLGSKTPWAYTQKFTAISYYNGTRIHYVNIIGTVGKPQLVKMAENPTTEPNGLEVSFSVLPKDFHRFVQAARVVLRPFAIKPLVKGQGEFTILPYTKTLASGPGWSVHESDGTGLSFAVMGNVEYPLGLEHHNFSPNVIKLLRVPLVAEFPLGSFEMTPSRESIQWTEYTTKAINDRLETIYEELTVFVDKQFEAAKTAWDAGVIHANLIGNSALRNLGLKPMWRGMVVTTNKDVPTYVNAVRFEAKLGTRISNYKMRCTTKKTTNIRTEKDVKFFLADFPGAESRVSSFVRSTFGVDKYCYLISPIPKPAEAEAPELSDGTPDPRPWEWIQLADFHKFLGIELGTLTLASEIPKAPRVVSQRTGNLSARRSTLTGSKSRAFLFNEEVYGSSDECWSETEVDLSLPGFYIPIERWNPIDFKASSLKTVLKSARALKLISDDVSIIGVRNAHLAKFEKNVATYGSHFKPFLPFLKEELKKKWESDKNFRVAEAYFDDYREARDREFMDALFTFVDGAVNRGVLGKQSYLAQFVAVIRSRLYSRQDDITHFNNCKSVLYLTVQKEMFTSNFMQMISDRYPLLAEMKGVGYSWDRKSAAFMHLIEYIEMMDSKIKKNKESKS